MKRVLVTGAGGFIGRQALAPLAARGYEVHALASRRPPEELAAAARWHQHDLLRPDAPARLLDEVRPTHLLHLAWYAVPGKFWAAPENLEWVRASLALFRAFADAGGSRVVAAGTCAEYAWGGDGPCAEDETPLKPSTLYGACKHATRVVLEAFAAQESLGAAWGRIFFLYGPAEPPSRLVASVTRSLLRGEPALCTHGRQVRDFLHVEDVASAFAALLDSDAAGAVNIASGRGAALSDVIFELGDLVGRRDLVRLGAVNAPASEPPSLVADVRRLREEVGWSPKHGLREGLASAVEWWRHNL